VLLTGGTSSAGDNPLEPAALFYRGLYEEVGIGDLEKAIATYRVVVDSAPEGSELAGRALVREGICLEILGREKEALECYDRAVEEFPGSAAMRERVFSEMVLFLPRAAPLPAREKEIGNLIAEGRKCLERGAMEEAKKKFRTALYLEPDDHELQLQMASTCARLGNDREAAFYYNLTLEAEEYRRNFSINRELAQCYRNMEEFESAIKLWRAYRAAGPPDERSEKLAEFELELIQEESENPGRKTIPWKLTVLLARGARQTRDGKYGDARATYRGAMQEFPDSYLPPYRLGVLYEYFIKAEGEAPSGARSYESTLGKAPPVTAQRLRFKLALLYEESGDVDKASYYIEQYFMRGIRLMENDHILRERIRKKHMWQRVRRMQE
jgi:tetratricopeptide (TPR) repeat protein